jgi:hypothetical protein
MNIPGFSADCSVDRRSARYQSIGRPRNARKLGELFPALPIGGGGPTTKDALEKQGYKCELVATNFWECTKDGSPTYWCDSSSCQPKPLRVVPTRTFFVGGDRGSSFIGT